MLRSLFLINGIIELLGGVLFFVAPQLIFDLIDHQDLDYNIVRIMYSFAAVTIGFISNMIYVFYQRLSIQLILLMGVIFCFFHFGISTVLFLAFKASIMSHTGGFWFHFLLGILFIVSLIQYYRTKIMTSP